MSHSLPVWQKFAITRDKGESPWYNTCSSWDPCRSCRYGTHQLCSSPIFLLGCNSAWGRSGQPAPLLYPIACLYYLGGLLSPERHRRVSAPNTCPSCDSYGAQQTADIRPICSAEVSSSFCSATLPWADWALLPLSHSPQPAFHEVCCNQEQRKSALTSNTEGLS